jgi:hypothetical protein
MVLSFWINDDYRMTFVNITVVLLFIYFAYNVIEPLLNKPNTDKVRSIREEMVRLDLIEHLRDKIDDIQQKDGLLTDYNRINQYVNSIYDNIDTYMNSQYEYVYLFITELVHSRISKFIY